MSRRRRDLGRRGETLTVWLYRLRGFRILGRNVSESGVELDLVARRGGLVVFVEVKTRSGRSGGEPWEAITEQQRTRLVRAAEAYMRGLRDPGLRSRYDVVSIVWETWMPEIRIFPDAYIAIADAERPWRRRIMPNR